MMTRDKHQLYTQINSLTDGWGEVTVPEGNGILEFNVPLDTV